MSITPKPEPEDTPLPPRPAPDAKAKQAALKAHAEYRRAQAWAIARWPLEKRVVPRRARVHLPRTYLARHGSDVRVVHAGADLNQFVHGHYCEEVDAARGARKLAAGDAEGVLARRHEYLGPDPRVVGYWVDAEGDYHVKFYDTFLGDQWMDDRKWKFDVRMDEDGKWVDVDD
ncbi:hypothetical protein BD309DRAFT_873730 [Dichomitus squalens]|uniref:Uncharacterized protein n=2 Tax=Dichomitus squalens TaxID=114155 RepID=A0A4V2K313_9APHY|nr:uncharacterized protein DICSQDRAFT_70920 [Dichomitus squalens LYAD-421 SS1]EJF56745.1 hypothetical protein DICSQDRAFT_70920 [Dichomitus squalens LYAD-421 SS1]TBU27378.1 hypothetical protein BD311DRAFT_779004 [Dichomitus squalens]TBU38753.1 hypothetical protein BD309DRAFT_873730 [Dichomitus squalens]TBU55119.1 hypothetical protein BD310DRAFT_826627 [Dichomitus squalens]